MPGLVVLFYPDLEFYDVYVHGRLCERREASPQFLCNRNEEVQQYLDNTYRETLALKAQQNAIFKQIFGMDPYL